MTGQPPALPDLDTHEITAGEPARRHEIASDVSFLVESPMLFASNAAEIARDFATRTGELDARYLARAFPSELLIPLEDSVSPPVDDEQCLWLARKAHLDGSKGGTEFAAFLDTLEPVVSEFTSGRLGLLFEIHVQACLEAAFGREAVVARIPVRTASTPANPPPAPAKGTRTWGEFDVAFTASDGIVEHWELAVKFYLKVAGGSTWTTCVGPGVRDRLDIKGTRTLLRQLPLSATREGLDALARAFRQAGTGHVPPIDPHRVVRRAFTKGAIFYPLVVGRAPSDAWTHGASVEGLSPDHTKGWWVRPEASSLGALEEEWPHALACPLPRLRWMGGLAPARALRSGEPWPMFRTRLGARLARAGERNECLLVALHHPDNGRELTRGFVVTPRFLESTGQA